MITTIQASIRPIGIMRIMAVLTISLSASGSRNLPIAVIRLYLRAIYPSRKSVSAARTNRAASVSDQKGPGDNRRKNKNGTMLMRASVMLLGRFHISRLLFMPRCTCSSVRTCWRPHFPRLPAYFAGTFFQSSRNSATPLSVRGCFASCAMTLKGIVAMSAPIRAASSTCFG